MNSCIIFCILIFVLFFCSNIVENLPPEIQEDIKRGVRSKLSGPAYKGNKGPRGKNASITVQGTAPRASENESWAL